MLIGVLIVPALVSPALSDMVIQPGHEELLLDMLGGKDVLPGGCALTEGKVEGGIVKATYKCGTGEAVIELRHPQASGAGAEKTTKFALKVASGSAPDGFMDALLTRIRAREGDFQWFEPPTPRSSSTTPAAGASSALSPALGVLAVFALVLVVFGLLLSRRRAKQES